jgi:3D (Asp-Asp-Asp) domain-containing protein
MRKSIISKILICTLVASAILLTVKVYETRQEDYITVEMIEKVIESDDHELRRVQDIDLTPNSISLGEFKITAYCPCPVCCQDWSDGLTYTETIATENRTIAVDPEVIPLGSTVEINGAEYIAEDIGGAIKDNRIDVFFSDHDDALEFGVQYHEIFVKN